MGSDARNLESSLKKRRMSLNFDPPSSSLPTLQSPDYFMKPSVSDLAARELMDPGYCSRVMNFVVGRLGYGCIKFIGVTDVRWLDLDDIVKFDRNQVVVYQDESAKPEIGQGLNKAAEVTLILQTKLTNYKEQHVNNAVKKLKFSTMRQGAHFISFDPLVGEWKFSVSHFSRFGLSEDEEEDIIMDDVNGAQQAVEVNNSGEASVVDEEIPVYPNGAVLSHSLPAHLGLDPLKMREMKMMMFPAEEEDPEDFDEIAPHQNLSSGKELIRSSLQHFTRRMNHRSSPVVARKTPLALIEHNPGILDLHAPSTILLSQQHKGIPLKTAQVQGFKLDLNHETPVTKGHSRNIVDAGLFMGRSFRVGWGPNGILVHSGSPVGRNDKVLSSVIYLEKVSIDNVVRDEKRKLNRKLVDLCFDFPLNLHKSLSHEKVEVKVGSFKLKLQKLVANRFMLSEICRSYIEVAERQLEVSSLSSSARMTLMHQVMIWELIKVLFSDRENNEQPKSVGADNEEEMLHDKKEDSPEVDLEAFPFVRRAEFSFWLQESVCHRVQDEVSSLHDSSDLEHIFLLLTGRQLDTAVELAASKGDVRLACLMSQAGGSMVNRSDVARQLDLWKVNGLDFNFIEGGRIRLYELLSGNIQAALHDAKIDWKRFLGLLMWYQLPPDTSLPAVFHTYQELLNDERAPYPVPIYIDEGPVEEALNWGPEKRFDLAYYLMLLHGNEDSEFNFLKTMFSALSSTHDPLDYHMIWHQRAVLEAVGAFSSDDLRVLDMAFISQLLCLGQSHWAIYVVLHMPYCEDFPYLQAALIREILFQYCESWSSQEEQRQFIEDLGVPSAWLHEAMAVYYNYCGDLSKAMEHFLECANWQKAHSIFITSVAYSLFLSGQHTEIWRVATSMEDHKAEIEDWDLGAGIYISFYLLRRSLQRNNNTMSELDSLESKNDACGNFFGRLNESLSKLRNKLPLEARVAYSKMGEEICGMLLSDNGKGATREVQLSCFDTVFRAPIPEDRRSCHLQDAVSLFTCFLSEAASTPS